MTVQLSSTAELSAIQAQQLQSLSRFNLLGAKEGLETLLAQIGRDGIFTEYTRHDISHIDTLLRMLDWIVVPETTRSMTPMDWMLVVLAIYFHDAGLVVTRREFANREESDFPNFRRNALGTAGPSAYKEHVESLGKEEKERFLYQEFVRTHHAERIRHWIEGKGCPELGVADEAASAVSDLLATLDENFRSDLAFVCESHHLEDLDDLTKYNPKRAYGNDVRETANLQFAAILLRTVDLLHVTRDRTPSLAFSLIAPSDPKSIEEWHKQMEVVTVRKAEPRDEKGNVDKTATPETIDVTANFRDPLGFFSLTEYLSYAQRQLRQSHQWAETAAAREATGYRFPWRNIDSTQVKAIGFESRQFSFELDKPKILKLLTGHTLYNNPDVVVRELTQNSLDATRLQTRRSGQAGRIALSMNTAARTLTVDDNGTGMTQRVIENHFLNVGNSLYNDENFRKNNPGFSAISRFGIGILSIFMVSDEIEVITKAADEKQARNLSIRSLNGKYLVRLVDPDNENFPELLREHGTRVQLRLRPEVKPPDIREVAAFWILFPECEVTVKVDDEAPLKIGYASPKEALEATITKAGFTLSSSEPQEYATAFSVAQEKRDDLCIAYALAWQPSFKNWALATPGRLNLGQPGRPALVTSAICIHGVRVESTSPGFAGQDPLAISNITGSRAPATNVARSNLETSDLVDEMFSKTYAIYAGRITGEIQKMSTARGMSISTAASEGRYLFSSLQSPLAIHQCPEAAKLLKEQLKTVQCLTLDDQETRKLVSLAELKQRGGFWTTESTAYRSAEEFMRRIPTAVSIAKLANLLGTEDLTINGSLLGGYSENTLVRDLVLGEFEVDQIEILGPKRRINMHWRTLASPSLWKSITPAESETDHRILQVLQQYGRQGGVVTSRYRSLVIQNSESVRVGGSDGEAGIRTLANLYIFSGNETHEFLRNSLASLERSELDATNYAFAVIVVNSLISYEALGPENNRLRQAQNLSQVISQQLGTEVPIPAELRELISHPPRIFDPTRGERFLPFGLPGASPVD